MEFFGQWDRAVYKDGRVIIPKIFRKKLDGEVIITLSSYGFIRIYPSTEVEVKNLSPSQIWFVKWNKQGKITIPGRLKEKLKEKMVWYGEGDYLELRPK